MVAAKNWTLPKHVGHEFRYYVLDAAAMAFRAKCDPEFRNVSDAQAAALIDRHVCAAANAMQDIVVALTPSEQTKIVSIPVARDRNAYAVLQMIRPNSFPPPRTVGGPGGVAMGVVALVDIELGQENFARCRWKVAFRQLAKPLSKLLEQQESTDQSATGNLVTEQQPQGETTTMDATPTKRYAHMLEQAEEFGPKSVTVHVVRKGSRNAYSDEFKRKVVALVKKGDKMLSEVADDHGVSQGTLSKWCSALGVKVRRDLRAKAKPEKKLWGRGASDGRDERIAFAKEQYRLNPSAGVHGPKGVNQMVIDRFGVGLGNNLLRQLRREMASQSPKAAKEHAAAKRNTNPATAPNSGSANRIRTLLSDGVARSTADVYAALGITEEDAKRRCGIALSELSRRKNKNAAIANPSVGVYQMTARQIAFFKKQPGSQQVAQQVVVGDPFKAETKRANKSLPKVNPQVADKPSQLAEMVTAMGAAMAEETRVQGEVIRLTQELEAAKQSLVTIATRVNDLIAQMQKARGN